MTHSASAPVADPRRPGPGQPHLAAGSGGFRRVRTPRRTVQAPSRAGWAGSTRPAAGGGLRRPTSCGLPTRSEPAGLTDVVLLGMGGSSLCAEVLRDVPARPPRRLPADRARHDRRARDSHGHRVARPRAARCSSSRARADRRSRSRALERHFWSIASQTPLATGAGQSLCRDHRSGHVARVARAPSAAIGARSSIRRTSAAATRRCRCSASCRRRCSALEIWLRSAAARVRHGRGVPCRRTTTNPGLALGAFMAAQAQAGRDKLTRAAAAGDGRRSARWIEQLVAESTGKLGHGVLPIVGEPIGPVREYGSGSRVRRGAHRHERRGRECRARSRARRASRVPDRDVRRANWAASSSAGNSRRRWPARCWA